ncbi:hypothetical protein [Thermoleptolyngbya sp.]
MDDERRPQIETGTLPYRAGAGFCGRWAIAPLYPLYPLYPPYPLYLLSVSSRSSRNVAMDGSRAAGANAGDGVGASGHGQASGRVASTAGNPRC